MKSMSRRARSGGTACRLTMTKSPSLACAPISSASLKSLTMTTCTLFEPLGADTGRTTGRGMTPWGSGVTASSRGPSGADRTTHGIGFGGATDANRSARDRFVIRLKIVVVVVGQAEKRHRFL